MRTVLRFLFIAVLLCPLTFLKAQQPPQQRMTPEERAKMETTRVKEQLTLTDAQTTDYEKIALKYAKEQSALREKFKDMPRDSIMAKMTSIQKSKAEEVKKILTAEQQTKYEKFLQENRGRFGGGNRPQNN
ncbi:MAG: hypothetical protein Q8928_00745 [Bacteroidota bacterium]|nr:hypothetical protein [Bacteroidota bacterium]